MKIVAIVHGGMKKNDVRVVFGPAQFVLQEQDARRRVPRGAFVSVHACAGVYLSGIIEGGVGGSILEHDQGSVRLREAGLSLKFVEASQCEPHAQACALLPEK